MTTGLVVSRLSHGFNRRLVLSKLNLTVLPGQIVGLLGPNGAGKSTALAIIAGQLKADEGTVTLSGQTLDGFPLYRRARLGLGYLAQEPSIFRDCTVRENVEIAAEGLGAEIGSVKQQLTQCGLGGIAQQRAGTLSGGERRRLELARCLVGNPSFLLLDEPFSGVDPIGISDLQQRVISLAQVGIGVLVTDHSVVATLNICHHVLILDGGIIMSEGCPEDVAGSEVVRERYLGHGFEWKKNR